MEILRNIPNAESGARVTCVDVSGQTWVISQNPAASASARFTLYRAVPDGFERVETAASPLDLYPRIDFGPEAAAFAAPESGPPAPKKKSATRRARPKRPTDGEPS